jgi:hypothetical protein
MKFDRKDSSMKNAIIAAIVSAVVAVSGAFAAGDIWSPDESQYRLRWADHELARCIILETRGLHAEARTCARFVRATPLPPRPVDGTFPTP